MEQTAFENIGYAPLRAEGGVTSADNDSLQHTLHSAITCVGIGLHSGAPARLRLVPAPVESGIVFRRLDVDDADALIPARYDLVSETRLCTTLTNPHGVSAYTVEHLLAALAGCGIDNLIIELDGPEVPIMDGSAAPFVDLIDRSGLQPQAAARPLIVVNRCVTVEQGGARATLAPGNGFSASMDIAFPESIIGHQRFLCMVTPRRFKTDIGWARTFGFPAQLEALRHQGLARGASLDNAIAVDGNAVLNPEGLRHHDEFVRHKLLDCVGDMALAGAPLAAAYSGVKAGHAINNALLRALFARPENWSLTTVEDFGAATPARA